MELAETGLSTAMLNLGLLLDKYDIFDTQSSFLAMDVSHSQDSFNINKYLAFNYFKTAVNHPDTQDEAMLKLGDFYYYGIYPLDGPKLAKAAHVYKYVDQNAKDSEVRGQALFNLGMLYHFGSD